MPDQVPAQQKGPAMANTHLLRCGGTRIDASQQDQRKVLEKVALGLAEQKDWQAYATVRKAIVAGEQVQRERDERLTDWFIRSMDDPGATGTHTRAEAYEASGRSGNVRSPWQRQTAKGDKAHIARKKQHSVRAIQDRAMLKVWGV